MKERAAPTLALVVHPKYAHRKPLTTGPPGIQDLPYELLFYIAARISAPKDLCALQQTSLTLRCVAGQERLWKCLCEKDFGTPVEFVSAFKLSWKEAYRLQRSILYNMMSSNSANFSQFSLGSRPIVLQVR